MAQQVIAIGPANGGQGDTPFAYTTKINANFGELYTRVAVLETANNNFQPLNGRLTALSNGTINGVAIGGSTPSYAAFTSISTPYLTLGGTTVSGVGTGANTLAAGNDSRITGAVQSNAISPALDTAFSSTRGAILYRGATGWTALPPGSSGFVLMTGGAGSDPVWVAQATGGSGVSSAALDNAFGSTQGSILYRGASAWTTLTPGTSGQYLTTGGSGANPSWTTPTVNMGSGTVVNSSRAQTNAVSTSSAQTPITDAAPTTGNTAAVTGLSAPITPKAATNKLRVRAAIQVSLGGTAPIVAAIFQGSNTTAVATNYITAVSNGYAHEIVVTYEVVAGSTAATSFYVGIGTSNGGTVTINGSGGGRLFGGTTYSSIEVTEVLP